MVKAKGDGRENSSKKQSSVDLAPTGIVELDEILGGGFPRGSVILISGNSGTGKTIFSLEWLFRGLSYNENGAYVTFTEPLFKTLRNLEGMSYYKRDSIEKKEITVVDVRGKIGKNGFVGEDVLNIIEDHVKKTGAQRLVIDSITAIAYHLEDRAKIRKFIFELGTILSTLGCTTILTSEVASQEGYSAYGVEEFISDGIILFKKVNQKYQKVRIFDIEKMRGIKFRVGENAFRITTEGIKIYPQVEVPLDYPSKNTKVSLGVHGIDKMAGGGVFEGSTNLVAGSTGSGKSVFGLQFLWEGLSNNEPCLLVGFEESKDQIVRNAKALGMDFGKYEKNGLLKILCAQPSQKYIEEHLMHIKNVVDEMKIKRCVIDSLSSIKGSFQHEQFDYFVKRLNAYLKTNQATSLFISNTHVLTGAQEIAATQLSSLADNIILFKYVEVDGKMDLMTSLIKTRGNDHSKSLRMFNITSKGIIIGAPLLGYERVMSGSATKVRSSLQEELRRVFLKYLGPMGAIELQDLKEYGKLEEEDILGFIDSMVKEETIKKQKGQNMKKEVHAMYGNHLFHEVGNESKVSLSHHKKKSFSLFSHFSSPFTKRGKRE